MDEWTDRDWWRVGWLALGVVLAGILGYVLLAFIGTFVTGLFLYYATRPFHDRLLTYVGQPSVAAILTLLALALPILALIGYTVAITIQELNEFATTADLGPLEDAISPYIDVAELVRDPATLLNSPGVVEKLLESLSAVLNYLGLAVSVLLHLVVVLAIAFYLLRDDHRLARTMDILVDRHDPLRAYVDAVDESLKNVFFGNLLNALITGAIGAVAYNLLNLAAPPEFAIPYPAIVGVLAGFASLVPVVGMKLVWVPLSGILAVRAWMAGVGWGFVALVTAVSVVVVDTIPDLLLRPYVSGRHLHVGAVMLSYILGPLLFGWYGIFLGPLLLVLVVHFYRLVLPELLAGRSLGSDPAGPDDLQPTGPGGAGSTPEDDSDGPPAGADSTTVASEATPGEDNAG